MRRIGGARRGLDMWLIQRASAIYMALFLPFFAIYTLSSSGSGSGSAYDAWRALFLPLGMKVAVLLCVLALLLHAWIGLREIFIDYLHCARCLALRLFLYFAFATLYLACLVWTVDILWSVK